MQFGSMTALLMRWQVIPANFVVFCNPADFCHPSGSFATEGNNNNNFHPVHFTNADRALCVHQPSDQANQFGLWVHQNKGSYHLQLTIAICYNYSARNYYPTEGGRLSQPTHCSKSATAPCPMLHISVAVAINTTVHGKIRTWVLTPVRHANQMPQWPALQTALKQQDIRGVGCQKGKKI